MVKNVKTVFLQNLSSNLTGVLIKLHLEGYCKTGYLCIKDIY